MDRPVYLHLSKMPRTFVDGRGIDYGRRSHWMGYPVMPANYPLPILPLPFLCQIDCRELPAEVADLPHDGILYIFADLDYYKGWEGEPMPMYAAEEYQCVIYIPEDELVDLKVRSEKGFGRVSAPELITLNFEKPSGEEPDHQLLGEPEHREWEDWDEPYEGWRLLFQMDSCDGDTYHYNFMDWGVFNILISPDDLKKRDFSQTVGIILST